MKTFPTREEWLKARTSYIGGSDASAILGLSPWTTNVELWELKTHKRQKMDINDKPEVKFGTDAEEHIRALFALEFPMYDVGYAENNMWTNSEYPWAHASLDGWLTDRETGRKGIFEVKTSNIMGAAGIEKWKNKIPDTYYCQLLHYFAVTEFDFAILKARLKFDFGETPYCQIRHYCIDRADCESDIEILMDAERKFVSENIEQDIKPALILPEI